MVLNRPADILEDDFASLFAIACDDVRSSAYSAQVPFYHLVSYMGVSMEALLGSPYLRKVEDAGLAGDVNFFLGKRECDYQEAAIGMVSRLSQKWIDRNFSLDYVMKSLEKRLASEKSGALHDARLTLKDSSYGFLLHCIKKLHSLKGTDYHETSSQTTMLDEYFLQVKDGVEQQMMKAIESLAGDNQLILRRQYAHWRTQTKWELINS